MVPTVASRMLALTPTIQKDAAKLSGIQPHSATFEYFTRPLSSNNHEVIADILFPEAPRSLHRPRTTNDRNAKDTDETLDTTNIPNNIDSANNSGSADNSIPAETQRKQCHSYILIMGNLPSSSDRKWKKLASSKPSQQAGAISPLVALSYVNQVRSYLMRLPDNILVAIMIRLEPREISKLRRVSREFMRIFDQHPHFKQYHTKITRKWLEFAPWAVPDPLIFFPGQSVSRWTRLCRYCDALRGDDVLGTRLLADMPLLYCSGCKTQHRIMHFSLFQREDSTDDERLCLGRQEFMQLGTSFVCSWRQAVAQSYQPSYRQEDLECADAIDSSCMGELCKLPDKSHVRFTSMGSGKMEMQVSRVRHFPVKRQSGGKISGVALWKTCEEIRSQHQRRSLLDNLCFDTAHMLRAFDPNTCSCVDWGSDDLPSPTGKTAHSFSWRLARPPQGPGREHINGGYVGKQGRCLGRQHGFSSHHAMGNYEVDILQCPDDPQMLIVQVTFKSVISSPTDPAWLCNLSLSSTQCADEAMRGITWCDEDGCGVRRAINRHQSLMDLEWKYGL